MRNIVLIGMPSSGKSTVGRYLANKWNMGFVDTDQVVLEKDGRALREIVIQEGVERFHQIQTEAILELQLEGHVIATGGSVVYSEASMKHLGSSGTIFFLDIGFAAVEARIAEGRRFARSDGQSFHDMYLERLPLYRKYAHATIPCDGKSVEAVAGEIEKYIEEGKGKV